MASGGDDVCLVGFDFGSTTTSALVTRGRVLRNCVTGRMELGAMATHYESPIVFTPLVDEQLDEERLSAYLDEWVAAAGVEPARVAAGGAVVTGLAAQRSNAAAVSRLVRARFGAVLVATADDPRLESWLAFMGNCLAMSRAAAELPIVNLDIGGGTANLAWGLAGQVRGVGCYFFGARHLRFEPGTYRLQGTSRYGRELLAGLGIGTPLGQVLDEAQVEAVLDFYIDGLERAVAGQAASGGCGKAHVQVPFEPPADDKPVITLSGGVGQLAYQMALNQPLPGTTAYGDLGIDLARRVCQSPLLSRCLKSHLPANLGRATLVGLTIHNVEISGSTLFLPQAAELPLSDLPVLGAVSPDASDAQLRWLVQMARASPGGACLEIECEAATAPMVKKLGGRIAEALRDTSFPGGRPLVLLTGGNIGKTLGHYATDWGALGVQVIVIDEVGARRGQFVNVGKPCQGVVPVSYYGVQ